MLDDNMNIQRWGGWYDVFEVESHMLHVVVQIKYV